MSHNLVTVASYPFVAEAQLVQSMLRLHGITAFVADAEILNMEWQLGNAIGYAKVQVPSDQADEARELIAEANRNRIESDKETIRPSPLEAMRLLKRPVIWLWLMPSIIGLALLGYWIFRSLLPARSHF